MKFTSVIVLASALLAATPSFAAPGVKDNRSLESVESIRSRELTDAELVEREPFFPLLFGLLRVGAQVGLRAGTRVASRVAKKGIKEGAKHEYNKHQQKKHKRSLDDFEEFLQERDLEDLLDARDLFGEEVYEERDFDELD